MPAGIYMQMLTSAYPTYAYTRPYTSYLETHSVMSSCFDCSSLLYSVTTNTSRTNYTDIGRVLISFPTHG